MPASTDVAVIGAGPYGLSIAAHLREAGIDHRVIGIPMRTWLANMPEGMLLKSAGFSSTLYDPRERLPLKAYCRERSIPYQDVGLPVSLETFAAYGLAFQDRLVPEVTRAQVEAVEPHPAGFLLRLDDGSAFTSRRVVVAVGLDHFRAIPEALRDLPSDLCSHSADNGRPSRHRGRDVVVVGGGSSAIDMAVLLHEAGARTVLAARRDAIAFNVPEPWPRPLADRVLRPMSGLGPGWSNLLTADFLPWIFPDLPDRHRLHTVRRSLGPAAGWFMKDRFSGVTTLLGHHLVAAQPWGERVRIDLSGPDGTPRTMVADHVVAATGYRTEVGRLPFLAPALAERVAQVDRTPRLSRGFESSVPGLHFVGPCAATSFGPVMRFAVGAGFTAARITRHLARAPHTRRSRPADGVYGLAPRAGQG